MKPSFLVVIALETLGATACNKPYETIDFKKSDLNPKNQSRGIMNLLIQSRVNNKIDPTTIVISPQSKRLKIIKVVESYKDLVTK